jgi:REP element-mobilizing transposase RayT
MNNHVHLLFFSGQPGISTFMRRLLTGYAVWFNRRHRRSGYLFQNRYKSIVCEEDAYLLEPVRYIHLNPIRSLIIKTIEELDHYRWSGHSVLVVKNRGGLAGKGICAAPVRHGKKESYSGIPEIYGGREGFRDEAGVSGRGAEEKGIGGEGKDSLLFK